MIGERIAVVGGGVAGLLAAAYVSLSGRQAVVFEATSRLGGRAATRVSDGFHFNQGPHALYAAGEFATSLRALGITINGGSPDVASGVALWQRGTAPLSNARAVDAGHLDVTASNAAGEFFHSIRNGLVADAGIPLASAIASLPPDARAVVEAFVRLTTYVHAPAEIEARRAFDQLRTSQSGAIYVDGGWASLVDGLVACDPMKSVEVRLNTRVTRVSTDAAGNFLCVGDKYREHFSAVVLALPPRRSLSILDTPELKAAVAEQRPVSIVGLDLGLAALPDHWPNFVLGMDLPNYLSVHSAVANLAPDPGALVHAVRYLAPDEEPISAHVEELEAMCDLVIPGWRDLVRHRQRLSGATVAHDFPRASNSGQVAAFDSSGVPGVFLAGDWVGETAMLVDAAAVSAKRAAASAVAYREAGSARASGLSTADTATKTAGAILMDDQGRILLGLRARHKRVAPGRWDIVGGRVEGEEMIAAALVRELDEELGITATEYVQLECIQEPGRPDVRHYVFAVFAWEGKPRNCSDEHDEIRWFTPAEIEALPNKTPFDFSRLIADAHRDISGRPISRASVGI